MTTSLVKLSAAAVAVVCAVTAGVWGFAPPSAIPTTPPSAESPASPPSVPAVAASPIAVSEVPKPAARVADAPQRMRSSNNLKQIMLAIHAYHDQHKALPRDITDTGGKPLLSWRVHLLPYLEQGALYKQFYLDEPWDSENNKKLLAKMPAVFRTGTEKDGSTTYYQGFAGAGTVFEPGEKITFAGIPDGTSNTIGVIEAGPAVAWTKPGGIPYDPKKPFPKLDGPFSNVFMVGIMDGSVLAIKPDIKVEVFRKLVERADGSVVDFGDARADLKPTAGGNLPGLNTDVAARLQTLQAEQQKLLEEAARKVRQVVEEREALARENEVLKQQVEELRSQIDRLKKGQREKPAGER